MQSNLIPFDDPLVRQLRRVGILRDFDPRQLTERENGIILVACSDGQRFPDLFAHLRATCGRRIHTFCWHGGACRLVSDSPMNKGNNHGFADDLLHEVRDAVMVVAQTPTVVLSTHLPCGKARLSSMHWTEVLQEQTLAKAAVKRMIEEAGRRAIVPTVVHIHWKNEPSGEEPQRSYSFDADAWPEIYPEIHERVLRGAA